MLGIAMNEVFFTAHSFVVQVGMLISLVIFMYLHNRHEARRDRPEYEPPEKFFILIPCPSMTNDTVTVAVGSPDDHPERRMCAAMAHVRDVYMSTCAPLQFKAQVFRRKLARRCQRHDFHSELSVTEAQLWNAVLRQDNCGNLSEKERDDPWGS